MRVLACCIVAATMLATPPGHSQQLAQQQAQQGVNHTTQSVYAPKLDAWNRLPPTEVFENEEILLAAVDQIARFQRREVEAMARLLADCQEAPTPNVLGDGYCRRARVYFEITVMPYGPLGLLFAAISTKFTWVNADWQRTDSAERAQVIQRLTRIEGMWRAAVYARLVALDQERR